VKSKKLQKPKWTGDKKEYMRRYMPYWRQNKQSIESKQRNCNRHKSSIENWIKAKVYSALDEDQKPGKLYKDFAPDLHPKYIIDLYNKNPRCVYTGLKLDYDSNLSSLFNLSIDRIDNKLPHLKNNIQLTCSGINLARNNASDEDVKFFIRALRGEAQHGFSRIYYDFINSKIRQFKISEGDKCDLTLDFVLELWKNQKGRCALSGLIMAGMRFPCFSMSVDRIDNSKYHTQDNVRLTTIAMNRARKSLPDKEILLWLKAIREA